MPSRTCTLVAYEMPGAAVRKETTIGASRRHVSEVRRSEVLNVVRLRGLDWEMTRILWVVAVGHP